MFGLPELTRVVGGTKLLVEDVISEEAATVSALEDWDQSAHLLWLLVEKTV